MASRALTASVPLLLGCVRALAGQEATCPAMTFERMTVEGNAPIVTLNLKRVDGTSRPTRFVFDSGGGAIILNERLADDLGLKPAGEPITDGGARFLPTVPPVAQFGLMTVKLDSSKAFIHVGGSSFDTRERVEGLLPGKALEPYEVVLDYPKQRFSIAHCRLHCSSRRAGTKPIRTRKRPSRYQRDDRRSEVRPIAGYRFSGHARRAKSPRTSLRGSSFLAAHIRCFGDG